MAGGMSEEEATKKAIREAIGSGMGLTGDMGITKDEKGNWVVHTDYFFCHKRMGCPKNYSNSDAGLNAKTRAKKDKDGKPIKELDPMSARLKAAIAKNKTQDGLAEHAPSLGIEIDKPFAASMPGNFKDSAKLRINREMAKKKRDALIAFAATLG